MLSKRLNPGLKGRHNMRKRLWPYVIVSVVGAMATAPEQLRAGEQTFVLQDHINRQWTRELVSFPVSFENGACRADAIALRGPKGKLPCQFTDVTTWPGGTAKTATLWFIADVPKLTRCEYVLTYGAGGKVPQPATDLEVSKGRDTIEITTKHFGVRLLMGKKTYRRPEESKRVPGPVGAFLSADGKWFGGRGTLYGPLKVRGYTARLVEQGPVVARWQVRYTYTDRNTLTVTVTMAAGDNAVFFEQTADKDAVDIQRQPNSVQGGEVAAGKGDNGFRIGLNRGLAPLLMHCQKEGYLRRPYFKNHKTDGGRWADIPMATYAGRVVTALVPWSEWWSTYTQTGIRFRRTDRKSELRIVRWDSAAWVNPELPHGARRRFAKAVSLVRDKQGDILMQVGTMAGVRKWTVGEGAWRDDYLYAQVSLHDNKKREYRPVGRMRQHWQKGLNDPCVARGLDVVKDWVLEWKEPPGSRHPRLFISRDELQNRQPELRKDKERIAFLRKEGKIEQLFPGQYACYAMVAYLRTGDPKIGRELKLVERLGKHLDKMGDWDLRGATLYMTCLYDGLIDSELISEKQRKLFRAQMAYLAYKSGDPATWSVERGYASGNPNMSVVVDLTRGLIGCMLRSHPESDNWVGAGVTAMKRFMKQVGSKGEWHESAHYSHVSASTFLPFAIAARKAGVHDFFADGDVKRLMLYLAKIFTPADPERDGLRVAPPWGRSHAGWNYGHSGAMAAATADSDPEYSKQLQWVWKRTGYSLKINYYGQRFGGFEELLCDRTLPEQAPDWTSEWFPQVGVIMRHGMGTPQEHFLGILTRIETLFIRGPEGGSVMKWYSRGVPIGGAFTGGYGHRYNIFSSRVMPAHAFSDLKKLNETAGYYGKTTVLGFAALPPADYLRYQYVFGRPETRYPNSLYVNGPIPEWPPVAGRGKTPMTWRRQALWVKDVDPAGVSYLVLRDTVEGHQPTMWQFWTHSQKLGTPQEIRKHKRYPKSHPVREVPRGGKPPKVSPRFKIAAARKLTGDRFTAAGDFAMDIEYYVAAPTDGENTPRHTLRYGDEYHYPIARFREYMDLLHLQLPGDGHYFVAIVPRVRKKEKAPTFETVGGGTVIKIKGAFGTDYAFLSDKPTSAKAEDAAFTGTAGVVQDRKSGLTLSLDAKGEVGYKRWAIVSDAAASLRVAGNALTVTLSPDHKDQAVTVKAAAMWRLAAGTPETVRLEKTDGGLRLTVPGGVLSVGLSR